MILDSLLDQSPKLLLVPSILLALACGLVRLARACVRRGRDWFSHPH